MSLNGRKCPVHDNRHVQNIHYPSPNGIFLIFEQKRNGHVSHNTGGVPYHFSMIREHLVVVAQLVAAFFVSAATAEETPFSFLVMADWHGAEWYSHHPVPGPDEVAYWLTKDALAHIRDLYGGDLIIMPGDTNDGRWYRQDWVDQHFPGLSPQEAVYKAGINCYGTIRRLFSDSGYDKILVSIGDHELGEFFL